MCKENYYPIHCVFGSIHNQITTLNANKNCGKMFPQILQKFPSHQYSYMVPVQSCEV